MSVPIGQRLAREWLREHVLLGHHEEMDAVPDDHLGSLIIERWHRMEHASGGPDHEHEWTSA